MHHSRLCALASMLALTASVTVALAEHRGTAEQAIELLDHAAKHYQEVGKDKALGDFSSDKANFTDRDLYVFCFDDAGIATVNGANKALIGLDAMKIRDAQGRLVGAEMVELVKAKGEGWIDYSWVDPASKKIMPKSSFVRRIGDQICAVGIYK